MAVAVTVDVPGGTEQQYQQITAKIFPDGKLPEGWLVHLAGPTENGWRVAGGQCRALTGGVRGLRPRAAPARRAAGRGPAATDHVLPRPHTDPDLNQHRHPRCRLTAGTPTSASAGSRRPVSCGPHARIASKGTAVSSPLHLDVFVVPNKPIAALIPPMGKGEATWPPTSNSLISGERDAVLIDTP